MYDGEAALVVRTLTDPVKAAREFKPGFYKHYKGGFYTALMLVTHHDSRMPYVIYVSHTYGGPNTRPLIPVQNDLDAWTDVVRIGNSGGEADWTPRFAYIGELPSNETMVNRDRLHCSQPG